MEKLEVQVGCITKNGTSPSTRFKIRIDVGDGLTQRERAILFNSARNCEMGKIIDGEVDIDLFFKFPSHTLQPYCGDINDE